MEGPLWGARTAQLGRLHGHVCLRAARSALCMFRPAFHRVQPVSNTLSFPCVIAALCEQPCPSAGSTALQSQSSHRA